MAIIYLTTSSGVDPKSDPYHCKSLGSFTYNIRNFWHQFYIRINYFWILFQVVALSFLHIMTPPPKKKKKRAVVTKDTFFFFFVWCNLSPKDFYRSRTVFEEWVYTYAVQHASCEKNMSHSLISRPSDAHHIKTYQF